MILLLSITESTTLVACLSFVIHSEIRGLVALSVIRHVLLLFLVIIDLIIGLSLKLGPIQLFEHFFVDLRLHRFHVKVSKLNRGHLAIFNFLKGLVRVLVSSHLVL